MEAPRLALASNTRNSYAQPQSQYQQQTYNQGGVSQGTYTASQQGQGFQSVSSGSYAGQNYQQPQANYGARQQQNNYQQSGSQQGYNQESTTPIPIIKYENEPHRGDGRYRFEYLTGNGIMAQEEGYLNNPNNAQWPDCEKTGDCPEQVAIGSYSYTAPDGQQISVSYKADANGFQPEGDHLPQPVTHTPEFYAEVEKQQAIAAEIEAEGARILALQAEQSRNQPQQNQYRGQQQQQNYQQQSSNSYNYQAQPSNNVYRQQPTHSGYNQNAQAVNPQQLAMAA